MLERVGKQSTPPARPPAGHEVSIIEVFADIACPFTHVGLRRLVARREARGRDDVRLWVRAWPLEIVNGGPLDPTGVAQKVRALRAQVAPDLFRGFDEATFPATFLPAMALAAGAYAHGLLVGERVSLALRDSLFEQGADVSDRAVLGRVAADHGLSPDVLDLSSVLADHDEGVRRGVVGSPQFFTSHGAFFCPALEIEHDERGELVVTPDAVRFDRFVDACFAPSGDR